MVLPLSTMLCSTWASGGNGGCFMGMPGVAGEEVVSALDSDLAAGFFASEAATAVSDCAKTGVAAGRTPAKRSERAENLSKENARGETMRWIVHAEAGRIRRGAPKVPGFRYASGLAFQRSNGAMYAHSGHGSDSAARGRTGCGKVKRDPHRPPEEQRGRGCRDCKVQTTEGRAAGDQAEPEEYLLRRARRPHPREPGVRCSGLSWRGRPLQSGR